MSIDTTATRGSEYFDFDAWHAEQHGATIPFRLLGQDWQLPGDCDAAVLLRLQRIEQWVRDSVLFPDDDIPIPDGLTAEDITGFSHEGTARALIGDDLVDQWLEKGIPSEMLRAVSKRLYAIYSGRDADAAIGLGKPQAATRKAPQDRKPKTKKTTAKAASTPEA